MVGPGSGYGYGGLATNILNTESWTRGSGRSSCSDAGLGLTSPRRKQILHWASDREPKMDMGFGTWNVRSLYSSAFLQTSRESIHLIDR